MRNAALIGVAAGLMTVSCSDVRSTCARTAAAPRAPRRPTRRTPPPGPRTKLPRTYHGRSETIAMSPSRTILETERLRLREMTPADLEFLASLLGDPAVMRHYPAPLDRAAAVGWLDRQRQRYADDGCGLWLVEHRAAREPVGQVGLVWQDVDGRREPELGWMIAAAHQRRGYATEAARAVRTLAFDAFDLPGVIALIEAANEPSRGVARRLGMTLRGETVRKGRRQRIYQSLRTTPPPNPAPIHED